MAGFLLLQLGMLSNAGDMSPKTQLASADRGTSQAATRGSARTGETPVSELAVATPATEPTTVAPTTVPPTPPTTVAPKPVVATATPKPTTPPTTVAPKPVVAAPPATSGDDAVWTRLAQCESGMRNDTGAPYYGYFQFAAGTWTSMGGSGLPSDHTYAEQLVVAKALQARSGWGQWPVCSKTALAG